MDRPIIPPATDRYGGCVCSPDLNRRQLLALTALGLTAAGCAAKAPTAQPTSAATSPSPATLTFAPTTVTVPSGVMLCREAWGAKPAKPGGRPQTVTRMTLHHSAVALPDNRGIVARLQQHQRYHQVDKGWVDIAYHVAVDREGNIFQLRDTAIAGDTATEYDTAGHFLVLAEGNFDEEPVSEAQLSGTALAFAWAAQRFGLSVDTLASHREVAPGTSCPGQNLEAHMTSGDLHQRVADLLVGGVDLRPLCGPEADARVAAIEAGR